MGRLSKLPENVGRTDNSVERVLDAIRFQTAVLALNAAVEAAHTAPAENTTRRAPSSQPPPAGCRQFRQEPAPTAPHDP